MSNFQTFNLIGRRAYDPDFIDDLLKTHRRTILLGSTAMSAAMLAVGYLGIQTRPDPGDSETSA